MVYSLNPTYLAAPVVMANLFLRLSSSFACVLVRLFRGRKRETAVAHIVVGVHFEGARIGFLLKYKQKTKKDEPEKTKDFLCHFRFVFLHFLLILQ